MRSSAVRIGERQRGLAHMGQPPLSLSKNLWLLARGLSVFLKTYVVWDLPAFGRGSSRGQPPASSGIECPVSLAGQGLRPAQRGLLCRRAAQK